MDMKLYSLRLQWAHSSGSDLIAMLNAYQTWRNVHESGQFGKTTNKFEHEQMKMAEREWADNLYLDIDALYECNTQINELKFRLKKLNIRSNVDETIQWSPSEKAIILKVVIAGAFYPNYFARSPIHSNDYVNDLFKTIGTRDPRYSVYLTGFPREHIRHLYIKSIKNILFENDVIEKDEIKDVRVDFDAGSNKTFITFKSKRDGVGQKDNELMPGQICTEVYKALKMRELKLSFNIWVIK